jgi:hypothetical protein
VNHNDPIFQKIARYSPQDILLADVAVRIQLSPTEYITATKHYEVMGDWIDRPDSPLRGLVSGFYPQGGFSTGSTIASHDDRSDFDLDAMAVVDWPLDVDPEYALATLHGTVAGEKGSRYHDKADRKTRCTQIVYDGMHLDVTPSVLISHRAAKTSFIFHSKPSDPSVRKETIYANPYGLAEWFNDRTQYDEAFATYYEGASLDFSRVILLEKADTTPVPAQAPAYRKSKQVICLQLMKRWRNIAYDRRHRGLRLPPSVLLTYYIGENTSDADRSLLDELIHHVDAVTLTIETAVAFGNLVEARNPKCEEDRLTDRWPGTAQDQKVFLDELHLLQGRLAKLKNGVSLDGMREILENLFGETPANEAVAAFRQRHVNDNAAGKGLYIPGRGAVPALGSVAAPSIAKAVPYSTPFGD